MAPRSVLITGCSLGGAGEALAQEFHQKGFRVFATARSLGKIQHLEADGIEVLELDVSEIGSIKKAAGIVSGLTDGKLDILINNAGQGHMVPLLDMDHEKARKTFDLNVFAPISVIQAFIPLLIAGKGTIVNIGSYVDRLPVPWQGVYNASKAALRALTDNLRLELRPFGIKVVYIATGGVFTNFLENLETVRLRETSLYAPGKEKLEPVMNYEGRRNGEGVMRPAEYAKQVYDAATAGVSKERVIAGTGTPLLDMPSFQSDDLLAAGTGIQAFAEQVQRGNAQAGIAHI